MVVGLVLYILLGRNAWSFQLIKAGYTKAEAEKIVDDEYPFTLLTGRGTVFQFHTQTRTGKVEMLRKLYPQEPYVQINPADADNLGIENGQIVRLISRRAIVSMEASVTEEVQPKYLFIPMHYYETNRLTFPTFYPYSFQPGYKCGAICVEKLLKAS